MLRRKSKAERKFDLARGKKASSPVPGSAARLPLSPVSSNTRHNSFSEASPAKRPSLATRAKSKAKSAIKKGGAVSSVLSPRLSPRFSPRGPRHTLPNDGSKEHDECILEDSRYEARHFDIENELASTIASKEVNTPPPPAAPSPEATPLPVLKSSITPKQLQTTPATNKAFSVEDAQRVIAQGTVRMRGERLKTKIQEEEVIKLTRTPAKPPAKKEEEPRLVASQDSMTTNQAPSPPLVETAPAFTPVPDEASEELGSGIIKDFLTTPSPPSPPSPPTPEAGAPLPSTAWAKTTLEPANARTDHNEELDSLEKDTSAIVASFRSIGSATIDRLRRLGSVMSSDEDAVELIKTPPESTDNNGHHGPTPSLIDITKLFQIPESELRRIAPEPPTLASPRAAVSASLISPRSPLRSTARSCGRATPLRGHERTKSGEIAVKTPFSVKSRRSNY